MATIISSGGRTPPRLFVVVLTSAALVATALNPHFAFGGAYDVYATTWWSMTGAALCVAGLAAAAVLLWRNWARHAFGLLVGEQCLFLVLTAAAVRMWGVGYFATGWGRDLYVSFIVAVCCRVLLIVHAHRQSSHLRSRACTARL